MTSPNRRWRRLWIVALAGVVAACSGDDGRSIEAFCDQLGELSDFDTVLEAVDLDDSDAVRDGLDEFKIRLTSLERVAPDDIVGEVGRVVRFGHALADAALEARPDDPFDRAALLAEASAQVPDIASANDAVSNYVARRCTVAPGS